MRPYNEEQGCARTVRGQMWETTKTNTDENGKVGVSNEPEGEDVLELLHAHGLHDVEDVALVVLSVAHLRE